MSHISKNITLILWLLICFNSNSQVTKKLQSAYDDFNYLKFEVEYKKENAATIDEQHLWVEVSYKLRKFDVCLAALDKLKPNSITDYEKALEQNILDHQKFVSGEILFDFKPIQNNSELLDFSCLLKDSILLFSSNRNPKVSVKKVDIRDELPFLNLYSATVNKDSTYKIKTVNKTIHKYNEGPISVFGDGYLLTRNYNSARGSNNLKMVYLDSSFNELGQFEFNDESYSVGHATISKDGSKMVFVSDMPKGDGITDLFITYRQKDTWSQPERLPSNINSPGNEMFPLIQGDKLFFSSNGHGGNGELDIYEVPLNSTSKIPLLLPYPINSNYDDFGFVSEDGGITGYLTSDRNTETMDDIYYFNRGAVTFGCEKECENEPCVQFEVNDFEDFPYDRFEFQWDFGDGTTDVGPYIFHCYEKIGTYNISLSMYDKIEKKTRTNLMQETVEVKSVSKSLPAFSIPDEIGLNQEITLSDKSLMDNGRTTESFWDLGDGTFSKEATPTISFNTPGYKKVKRNVKVQNGNECCYEAYYDYVYVKPNSGESVEIVEISESGLNLFERPDRDSTYIVKILVKDEFGNVVPNFDHMLSFHKAIISSGTIGDTLIQVLKTSEEYTFQGTSSVGDLSVQTISTDNKTEEQFGFYEFIVEKPKGPQYIVRSVDPNGGVVPYAFVVYGSDTIGKTNANGLFNLPEKPTKPVFVGKKFYFGSNLATAMLQPDKPSDVILSKVEANAVIRLENIYFDLSKWNIRPDAAVELNKVVALMEEYPTMVIELRAHTDARGTSSSNMTLSDKRAKSSASYIISKGIASERIKGQGYGETMILNECTDGVSCSKEKHQWNRRVEVAILSM